MKKIELVANSTLNGGKYKIKKVLGQGGFGITYLASQKITIEGEIGKIESTVTVAIKEFFMEDYCNRDGNTSQVSIGSASRQALVAKCKDRFIKEAISISRLRHQNIIKVVEIFEDNDTAYYVMEHIDGGSLSDLISHRGAMSEEVALRYITQVANALAYIHDHRINHLDVKPSNILVKDSDTAILIDFGLAKQYDIAGSQTSTSPLGASKGYAPMEQYIKSEISSFTPATDIYSLGATLYKLVTGKTPPHATEVNENGLPDILDGLSTPIKNAIEAAMQPKRKDRPQSIAAFLSILSNDEGTDVLWDPVIDDRTEPEGDAEVEPDVEVEETPVVEEKPKTEPAPQTAPPTSEPNNTEQSTKKSNLGVIIGVAVAILVIIGGYLLFSMSKDAETITISKDSPKVAIAQDSPDTAKDNIAPPAEPAKVTPANDTPSEPEQKVATTNTPTAVTTTKTTAAPTSSPTTSTAEQERVAQNQAEYEKTNPTTAEAQYNLGKDYYHGRNGVAQSYSEAIKWYSKAAEQGYAAAQNSLGESYYYGRGVSQNHSEAVKWYGKAAAQGYVAAQYNLGYCYNKGQGVAQSYSEAAKWYSKAAEQGYAYAQNSLGESYYYGRGVSQNHSEAAKWYSKAAEQGYVSAQFNLGFCYFSGQGVTQSYSEAAKWYGKAAEQGNASAQNILGEIYYFGRGVTQDHSEAVKWYRKSAEQGEAAAQYNLGFCYKNGVGVAQDIDEAVNWYRKSAAQGNEDAKNILKELGY